MSDVAVRQCIETVTVRDEETGVETTRPCEERPMYGLCTCRTHTGKTRRAESKRERWANKHRASVGDLLVLTEVTDQHPLDGLLEAVRRSGAMMRMLGALVGELDPGTSTEVIVTDDGTPIIDATGIYGPDHLGDQAPHVLLELYGIWTDRFTRACKLALDANLDERLVRNAEATTGALFAAVQRAIAGTDLDPVLAQRFKRELALHLRRELGPSVEGQVMDAESREAL